MIEDMWLCDCEVIDGNTLDALDVWDNNGQLPLQVKFYCRFTPTSDIVQQTFWVVPKQNPEVIMREIIQQNPGGPEFTDGGDGGDGGNVDIPAGGGGGGIGGGNGGGAALPTLPGR